MFTLTEAVELAFLDLEESYVCSWRTGKGSKESIMEAFSQREVPPYIYLGFKGSDGLRHALGRAIPNNNKPKFGNKPWEDWVFDRIGLYFCETCGKVHEVGYDIPCTPLQDLKDTKYRADTRELVSAWICEFLLENPCEICKETDIRVLEFDHLLPENKSFDIGNRGCRSLGTVQKEISKCRVLCANCHKKHTGSTQNHFKNKYFTKLISNDTTN